MVRLINCLTLLCCLIAGIRTYQIPTPTIQVYRQGLEVSIPDEQGISNFTFGGRLDKQFEQFAVGDINGSGLKDETSGRWIFKDTDTKLNLGDTLYYWAYVNKDWMGYIIFNRSYKVENYVNEN